MCLNKRGSVYGEQALQQQLFLAACDCHGVSWKVMQTTATDRSGTNSSDHDVPCVFCMFKQSHPTTIERDKGAL